MRGEYYIIPGQVVVWYYVVVIGECRQSIKSRNQRIVLTLRIDGGQ